MSRLVWKLILWSSFVLVFPARAQEQPPAADTPTPAEGVTPEPPRGPADIMKRAQQRPVPPPPRAPVAQPAQAPSMPEGHPPVTAEQPAAPGEASPSPGAGEAKAPVGTDPHAGQAGAPPLARRQIATATPNPALPTGTIRVRVLDSVSEQPVSGAKIQLGTMTRENTRSTKDATASAAGEYTFEKLAAGDGQAYRVNVLHQGAKYSSTPFRLPPEHGYDVTIRQLPTTQDPREIVLYVGATSIELRDERLKIVQQARLVNIGSKTYVFPDGGQLVKLPPTYTAFQTEEVMSDQQLRDSAGQGFRVSGSIPPGEVTLTWGFDIPYDSSEVRLAFELPWTTFAYRVLADAAPGMSLAVAEMPPPQLHEEEGRRFWVSEVMRRVGETPLKVVNIHVTGLPGPGPLRIIATVAAVLVLLAGAMIARRPPPVPTTAPTAFAFEERKAALVRRAAALRAERDRGEIGPEFFAEQIAEIEEQLAALLYEESRLPVANPRAA